MNTLSRRRGFRRRSRIVSRSGIAVGGYLRPVWGVVRRPILLSALLVLALLAPTVGWAAPAGTDITNFAQAAYGVGTVTGLTSQSNSVTVTTTDLPGTPSTIEFLQYAPTHPNPQQTQVALTECSNGAGGFVTLPPPTPVNSAAPIDLTSPVPLVPTSLYHQGEPIFVRVIDPDQNFDPATAETITVTLTVDSSVETEVIRLTETDPSSAVFVGYIQSSGTAVTSYDGVLSVTGGSEITATYVDPTDGTDVTTAAALVDPYGLVFDSDTGLPVDGVTITLIDTGTGLPAVVYGDDGISIFPAAITSGGTVTDSGGTTYIFTPGNFRFPFVKPGTYRFEVAPPIGYQFPSTVPTVDLQALPGGPFAIADPGSRGEVFTINPGPAVHIDIPVDPGGNGLYIIKTASKPTVSIGDFLRYTLTIENISVLPAPGTIVTDRLPPGFRYQSGSTRINGAQGPDPVISPDGRTLTFSPGDLPPGAMVEIRYTVEVAAGAEPGQAVNRVAAVSPPLTSNQATAMVIVRDDFFRDRNIIMGRVIADGCSGNDDASGIDGVRIYLEDGSYVVTDQEGRYHFEGVKPGVHVVQVDIETLPGRYRLIPCEEDSRSAGTPYARFIDLQGGTLWRVDFHAVRITDLGVTKTVDNQIPDEGETITYTITVTNNGTNNANQVNVTDRLPAGLTFASATPSQGDYDPVTGRWKVGSIPREADASLNLDAIVNFGTGGTTITNTATITGSDAVDMNRENNTAGIDIAVREPRKKGVVKLELTSSRQGLVVDYLVRITGTTVPVKNLRLMIDLPQQASYQPGGSQVDGRPVADPTISKSVLIYRLEDAPAEWTRDLTFRAVLALPTTPLPEPTEMVTKAVLLFDTPEAANQKTPVVENIFVGLATENIVPGPEYVLRPHFDTFKTDLKPEDQALLDQMVGEVRSLQIVGIDVVGHTDNVPIAKRSRHIFADNYTLSQARAESVVAYLMTALDLPRGVFWVSGMGPDQPIASNDTVEGRALNRRVVLRVTSETVVRESTVQTVKDRGDTLAPTLGAKPAPPPIPAPPPEELETLPPETPRPPQKKDAEILDDLSWLETAGPGTDWVWPPEDFYPPIPAAKVAVKHHPESMPVLYLNGQKVSGLNFDGTVVNTTGTAAVSLWRGVDLEIGDNLFEAVTYDAAGNETGRLARVIHYSAPPVEAEFLPWRSSLEADGLNPPEISVRLTDAEGHPARNGVIGEFSVDPPYMALDKAESYRKQPLTGPETLFPRYVVGENGVAVIRLAPTSRTGEATIRFRLADGEQAIRIWLTPEIRDWILVGLAEGTVGYNTVSGRMEVLDEAGIDDEYYTDGRTAFFAKGRIKGEWLLTLAYDTAKKSDISREGLYQQIDPDTYYTLYGDASRQDNDAPSADKLYLRIERRQFYALFGDYDTGLTVTELSRYSRNLTGFKTELQAPLYTLNLFAAETDHGFVRDEIRGDGTSGLYRLSQAPAVINSEKVVIETRDRFRSEVVLESRRMTRYIDYSVDFDAGTLFFKQPIPSRDIGFNPVYIVVDYETYNPYDKSPVLGGRGAVRTPDREIEIGLSYINEDQVDRQGDLSGLDVTVNLGPKTRARTELATSRLRTGGTETEGSAYLAELTHATETFDGKIYFREEEEGFGLGHRNGSESGTRKTGIEAAYRISDKVTADAQAYRHDNLATDAERDLAEVGLNYGDRETTLSLGLRRAVDTMGDGSVNRSDQLTVGAGRRFFDRRLTAEINHDQALGHNDNPDFPTRTSIGLDYRATRTLTVYAEQELTFGETADTSTTIVGLKASPWTGSEASSSVGREISEDGVRLFSTLGLTQDWRINQYWKMDAGLERSQTLEHPGGAPFNVNVPPSSGTDNDFTAVSAGAAYRKDNWSWDSRVETRYSETDDKWGLTTNLVGEPVTGVGLSAGLKFFWTDYDAGGDRTDGKLRFGLARRPLRSDWIVLDKLDFILETENGDTSDLDSRRVVNNLNLNYKPNLKLQLAFKYGARYSWEKIDGEDYKGFTDLIGLESRYDLSDRWDLGINGSVLHSWNSETVDYGLGVSVGYHLIKNAWVSVGYNFLGFEDKDFSDAGFTAQGPYLKFRIKFDQESAADLLRRF